MVNAIISSVCPHLIQIAGPCQFTSEIFNFCLTIELHQQLQPRFYGFFFVFSPENLSADFIKPSSITTFVLMCRLPCVWMAFIIRKIAGKSIRYLPDTLIRGER
jgi:hypothetical protein